MVYKAFCSTHRFHYSGDKCPFCEQDRIHSLSKRFNKTQNERVIKQEISKQEITLSDIEMLKSKFNSK